MRLKTPKKLLNELRKVQLPDLTDHLEFHLALGSVGFGEDEAIRFLNEGNLESAAICSNAAADAAATVNRLLAKYGLVT